MNARKTPKADLESKKIMFIQIGLVIALAIVLWAFEWKSYDKREFELEQQDIEEVIEEEIPITEQKVKPPPPPAPKQVTVIEIVDDDVEIEDDIEIDAEVDIDAEIEEFIPTDDIGDEYIEEAEIFRIVETKPSFPGGESALLKFLGSNINYPTMASESEIQGKIFLTFVVEIDGSITDVKILRGIGGGCDEEAVRVVKMMPRWSPGKQRGKAVRVQFNLPVKFILQ
jgi:protein TonB